MLKDLEMLLFEKDGLKFVKMDQEMKIYCEKV